VVCLISVIALKEFYGITAKDLSRSIKYTSYLLTVLLFIVIFFRQIIFMPVVIILWAIFPMTILMLKKNPKNRQSTGEMAKALLGPVYVGLPFALIMVIDRFPNGKFWILFLITVIFSSDTGAFYFGKLFGKHKLHEAISPGKTWEGAIGGLFCSIAAAFVFIRLIVLHPINIPLFILVISLSLIGQIGDLAESMLKRSHNIKDSSRILPGHGGILDRIDGLLFSIPALYLYLSLFLLYNP
jgi:phosphatidate cytidylyltransferase